MALEAGASGVLGGRAFWKEYFLQDGAEARSRFAATTALERVTEVSTLVQARGKPWFARCGLARENLAMIRAAEGWHVRYASSASASAGTAAASARSTGDVY
jgi:tagatose 1,6-diphosphate aldolase